MMKKIKTMPWTLALIINGVIAAFFGIAMLSPAASIKTALLPGVTTHGHYQIEMDCAACHAAVGGVTEDACLDCHAAELKAANDTHPATKFKDPVNAARLQQIDATNCLTCHREHVADQTLAMGLTLPADYCFHCHQETLITRPSHVNFAFDSCATAGCHNYHDNRALYENFLLKHFGEPNYLETATTLIRTPVVATEKSLDRNDANGPESTHTDEILDQWAETAHAIGGVNCDGCHRVNSEATSGSDPIQATWSDSVSHQVCRACHESQTDGFLAGKHGMRLARDLPPMTPGEARLPMHSDAAHQGLTCTACHDKHSFDTQHAAIDACLKCHNDDHSLAYKNSGHFSLWNDEMAGDGTAGSGVTCATCHMPRRENDDGVVFVDHHQSGNLRPNEKMIRDACLNCHGLQFSIDSLADYDLMKNCYASPPTLHNESIDMTKAWFDDKENKRLERINRAQK